MDISQIIKQTKNIILKELFTDINDKCCVLDLCIENKGKDIKIVSKYIAKHNDISTTMNHYDLRQDEGLEEIFD